MSICLSSTVTGCSYQMWAGFIYRGTWGPNSLNISREINPTLRGQMAKHWATRASRRGGRMLVVAHIYLLVALYVCVFIVCVRRPDVFYTELFRMYTQRKAGIHEQTHCHSLDPNIYLTIIKSHWLSVNTLQSRYNMIMMSMQTQGEWSHYQIIT